VKIAQQLTQFLTKAQRSLTFDTLHLSSQKRGILAHILVEFAEDLYQDIGIWKSLERYNFDFFGTPLPCILQPDEAMDEELVNPERIQFLLWTLYAELEPDRILAPTHQDLERLAVWIADFLSERFARMQFHSGVKTFLTTSNQYGWEVKRKLVWLGQHSYLFRLHCENYVRDHGGKYDVPTLDDFICQENTDWSGLGVIDILASTLDIAESQRRDLRSWYERHAGYFRVVSIHEPLMEVVNILNEQPYTVRVDDNAREFEGYQLVFGSLVPWNGAWYWSGIQHRFPTATEEQLQHIQQEFPLKAPQVVYRYCEERAEKARTFVREHYQAFVDYFGKELIVYADGATMAADMQAFLEHQNASKPQEVVAEFLKKHHRSDTSPQTSFPPKLLEAKDGVGVYFHPDEGQEMIWKFDDVVSGFQKHGRDVSEDEFEMIRELLCSDTISPQFVRKLVQEYGEESIASAFLIPQDCDKSYLEYLLRRYKGHFYRNRYPSITLV
jgi:hypothetical protein